MRIIAASPVDNDGFNCVVSCFQRLKTVLSHDLYALRSKIDTKEIAPKVSIWFYHKLNLCLPYISIFYAACTCVCLRVTICVCETELTFQTFTHVSQL